MPQKPSAPQPNPPQQLDPIVREILEQLHHQPAAATIVLGGGVAFKHYLDYRDTHDLDAWWSPDATVPEREAALTTFRALLQTVANRHGLVVNERRFSDVVSLELHDPAKRKAISSLQVAYRDRYIGSPAPTVWPPLQIEALTDTLASKMTALISRGAPRDMLDAYTACYHGLTTVSELWALWQDKNPALRLQDAQQQVLTHVTALEARRPLSSLPPAEREVASIIRTGSPRSWLRGRAVITRTSGSLCQERRSGVSLPPKNRQVPAARTMHIDASVYPDLDEPPDALETTTDRADYVHRICGAWDFGIVPDQNTFALFATWRDVFDDYPLQGSLAYHTFRYTFNWAALPAAILETPWERYDRQHGRLDPDPCLHFV